MLETLGVPLADSLAALGDVPARLVDDVFLYRSGKAAGEQQQKKGGGRQGGLHDTSETKGETRSLIAQRRKAAQEWPTPN